MILCVNSSPRKQSTDYVVSETENIVEDKGFETKRIDLRKKQINFCKHCDYCLRENECVQDDDMEEINSSLEDADGIILATPVYNSGVSAQLKTLMDRTRALIARNQEALKGKIGMGIAIGGDRMGGQEITLTQIHSFYILNGAIPVSGGSFGANLGATFWSKDTREGVKEDDEGFKTLEKTINRFTKFIDEYV